jgi:bifunctional non-homologous end joining protein LigD
MAARDTSIETYRSKRDFKVTSEPSPRYPKPGRDAPMFVVQKHQAHRAGLHWDFRLEHKGVLWSWAVRKGPSLDPHDKRIAAHVEDHPIDYADFQGTIPDGQYGAGKVETWDRGTWRPLVDPDEGMRDGEIKFVLEGQRLHGKFTLIRLKPKPNERRQQDNWLLIKGHDEEEREGADAAVLEAETKLSTGKSRTKRKTQEEPPAEGARRATLPDKQAPQLAEVVENAPEGDDWLTEIKFDGYRLLIFVQDGRARVMTRNGHDWTDRLPAVAKAASALRVESALLDGELVALDTDGVSSFPALQAALSAGRDQTLFFYVFDLLYLDGWDLRPCPLTERKRVLASVTLGKGMFRYSDHHQGDGGAMRRQACQMKLEGVICKQADAPYRAGRGHGWVKVKCQGREELIVLGWTPPAGSRTGFGALHLGYYDEDKHLHYAGGVGTGFSDDELASLSKRLGELAADPPRGLLVAGDPLDPAIHWVKPELVAEIQFIAWSGAGRVRHGVYLGLREDKTAPEVIRSVANPEADRQGLTPKPPRDGARHRGPVVAVPPKRPVRAAAVRAAGGAVITAKAPKARSAEVEGVTITHPDRELWPGITKLDLAEYWVAVADRALPGLAHRPLAILRCPEGIDGEHFFQKHGRGMLPDGIREGEADKAPFLAIDDLHGLVGMAQISAIELHAWGATEADPLHPDQLVFDLDPGEGVTMPQIVEAAQDVRARLEKIGLAAFCRTSGGKGLHVVVPLQPEAGWDVVKPFCRRFAEAMAEDAPDRYLSTVKIADRRGRILVDWLRNGIGATAVASFCPRARPGAGVATPLAWAEVTRKLDPQAFTLKTIPARLQDDPWQDFDKSRRPLPNLTKRSRAEAPAPSKPAGKARIVKASAPRKR